jgi:hypothetical protein
MARAVDADRLAAAGEIMSILRGRPSVRESIAAHESGERPILVTSIDDPLQAVLDRIAATGPPLTLCVTAGSTSMTVIAVRAVAPGEQEASWKPMPPGATLRDLVSRFWAEIPVTFQLSDPVAKSALALELA